MLGFAALLCALAHGLATPSPVRKIVGGQSGNIEDLNYQVGLEHFTALRCGGTIIGPKVILTASHCLKDVRLSEFAIRAGTATRYGEDGVVIKVDKYFAHPNFKNRLIIDNDVAILFLKEELKFSKKIQPATLPEFNEEPKIGSVATASGFGRLGENADFAPTLQFVDLPVLSNDVCHKSIGYPISGTMICAGYLEGGKDSCKQDSGGPLVLRQEKNKIIGVVSWSIGCARPKNPGIYARVAKFRKWIDCVVKTGEQCPDPDNP